MQAKRTVLAAIAMIITVGLVVGFVTGAFTSLARAGLYATGLWSSNGPSVLPPTTSAVTTPSATLSPSASPTPSASKPPAVDLPNPVLADAGQGVRPNPAKVKARVAGVRVKNANGRISGSVLEVTSGAAVFRRQAGRALIPASTMKLLTSAAVLSVLGPDHAFTTAAVSPKRGQLILVGGGDPYLATRVKAGAFPKQASVTSLARKTAAALRKDKIKSVRLGYDARLFSGPAWNPYWPRGYGDSVTPVSALWVDEGRLGAGSTGPRANDPARRAAEAYAAALRKQGIRVSAIGKAKAPRTAAKVASVSSMPLERIVEQVLMVSDNDAAEVLFRHVAVGQRRPGSSAEARKAVRAELTKLGLWRDGAVIVDGSGLARQNRIPGEMLARTLRLATLDDHPELRGVITGLPVAGVEGSLRRRYFDDESLAGRGVVRGKTGTLREVHTLAGLLRTRDGSVLVYAFLINNPRNQYAAKVWLDRVTAALSTCGCR